MSQDKIKDNNSKYSIRHLPPIIGYDQDFWLHCKEADREEISKLLQSENRKQYNLKMECDNQHTIQLTPYMYFIRKKRCIYCINPGERGALYYDDSIRAFWADERFDPEIISENSVEPYKFKCPFCGEEFTTLISKMINKHPKCHACNDGNANNPTNNNSFPFPYWMK